MENTQYVTKMWFTITRLGALKLSYVMIWYVRWTFLLNFTNLLFKSVNCIHVCAMIISSTVRSQLSIIVLWKLTSRTSASYYFTQKMMSIKIKIKLNYKSGMRSNIGTKYLLKVFTDSWVWQIMMRTRHNTSHKFM